MPSSHLKLIGTSTRTQDATGQRETSFRKTVRPLPSTHPIFSLKNAACWAEDSHTSTPCSIAFATVYIKRQPSHEKQGRANAEQWLAPTWSGSCEFKYAYSMATKLQPQNADHQSAQTGTLFGPPSVPLTPQWPARRWPLMAWTWLGPPVSAAWSLLGYVSSIHSSVSPT